MQLRQLKMEINVKITKNYYIKPSSPTPNHLRIFKLSLLDQLSHAVYGSMLLFYSTNKPSTVSEKSQLLQRSLSQTLTRFYPFAGRIKDNSMIECNDEGAVYLETEVDCFLSKLVEKPSNQILRKLIPVENIQSSSESEKGTVLLVQVSFFACGSLAIGVCSSHKISDARTVCTFIEGWAETALNVDGGAVLPQFNVSSIFPPQNLPSRLAVKLNEEKCVTQRFVFHASKIAALKAKAASESIKNPTRVEVVTALIWKTAMKSSISNSDQPKQSVLAQAVNIRKMMASILSEHSVGNVMGHFTSRSATDSGIDLASIVAQMRKGIQDLGNNYVKKLEEGNALMAIMEALKEMGSLLQGGNTDFYVVTSLCRFPFYRIDFGWGKPTWVVPPRDPIKNIVGLIDSKDGDGIEAWVTLKEADMAVFEGDPELLASASLNPSVFINSTIMRRSCL